MKTKVQRTFYFKCSTKINKQLNERKARSATHATHKDKIPQQKVGKRAAASDWEPYSANKDI